MISMVGAGLSGLSVLSLLLYMDGVVSFRAGVLWLLGPQLLGLAAIAWWARRVGRDDLLGKLHAGLWAAALATLAYDAARAPLAWSGIPVFQAISYFGATLAGVESPTPFSETLGWLYHLSNGLGFGLMYALAFRRPRLWTAVAWGLALEGAMLLTPYAEVFGYRRDARFVAITLGAHALYGLMLWAGLRGRYSRTQMIVGGVAAVMGIAAVAVDFHARYAARLAPSPPGYLGRHLYTTWDVPEVDRVAALWTLKRFVDPAAQFHYVPPFTATRFGAPFDVPEAEIRRAAASSATERAITQYRLDSARLRALAAMTHLAEVTPWLLPSDSEAEELARRLREAVERACGTKLSAACTDRALRFLDEWYAVP